MERRDFLAGTAALLVSPRRSWAAQGTPRRIGFLGSLEDQLLRDSWRGGLREKGWIEGKNLLVDYRSAPGRLPALAADLVALTPDLIIAPGPEAALGPEIGNRDRSNCVRGGVRSRRYRPRPEPVATGGKHNGSCDICDVTFDLSRGATSRDWDARYSVGLYALSEGLARTLQRARSLGSPTA